MTKRRKKFVLLSPKTLGIGFLLIALFFLLFWGSNDKETLSSPLSRFLHVPVSAIQSVRSFCAKFIAGVASNFEAKNQLSIVLKDYEELQKENQELHYKLRQHEQYREAIELPREEGMPVVTAIVIMRDTRMTQSLIINRGSEDGLDINMPVLVSAGLVGRTTRKITPHAAQVQPLTDPRSAVGVYVKERPHYEGILRGSEDGKQMLLTEIFLNGDGDETDKPIPGDTLLTSGHGLFPLNIVAGIISEATSELENTLIVEPCVNLNSVKAVKVLMRTQLQDEILSLLDEEP